MASKLYLGANQQALAERLAKSLTDAVRGDDCFVPTRIIVPNRYLGKWLRLFLARKLGVAINLRVEPYLEKLLWDLFQQVDGRTVELPLQLLNDADYRLMLVAALLEDGASAVEQPLRDYLGTRSVAPGRDYWRRLWQLADRLSGLLRDYEYHRQDALILKWLKEEDGYPNDGDREVRLERAQRALFARVVAQPHGLRELLGKALGKPVRTLPQYIGEVRELPASQLRPIENQPPIHLFGLTQISALHVHTLRWLGERFNLHLYHLNPLAGHLPTLPRDAAKKCKALRTLADRFGASGERDTDSELLHLWGHAATEALWLMAELLDGQDPFAVEVVSGEAQSKQTVLGGLQQRLTGGAARGSMAQDVSVQIVPCPGVFREVETVYQSIVHNLQTDASLRQTDIAVLAADMTRYRPVVQAVFDREPRHVVYNLADYSAAELSPFGHAVIGLLDLALESFTRSRVFGVLLNPCFLARQGVDREQAGVWLDWVTELGVFHGWDGKERQERGQPASALYSWRLGLQRLRLGRLMDVTDERTDAPALRYRDVIPYADLESGDREQLDAFGRSVEGLLPRLAELRARPRSGAEWARELRTLVDDFLAVPPDRPADEDVRAKLFEALDQLRVLDELRSADERKRGLPLALVRELVQESLETLKAMSGDFLTGGVTVSALQPLLPVPFRIIYVLGLGEDFPGTNTLSALDLRERHWQHGDIRPAEMNRFLFLQALLAAREKVYLLHNCRDIQKDRILHPSSVLNQLRRFLDEQVLAGKTFEIRAAPLRSSDPKLLASAGNTVDCLVSYSRSDRLLALAEAQAGGMKLSGKQKTELDKLLKDARRTVVLPTDQPAARSGPTTVLLTDLRNFLKCPIEAALKRHLGLYDDDEAEPADDEPFATASRIKTRLITETMRRFVHRAVNESVDTALAGWRDLFAGLHDEWRLRARVPDGAFAQVDRARLEEELRERIEGPERLAAFLRGRSKARFAGPVLLGTAPTPIGARTHFAALELGLENGSSAEQHGKVRLAGSLPLVWHTADALDVLVLTNRKQEDVPVSQLSEALLDPVLFWLALLCGPQPRAGDVLAADLLGRKPLRVHVARRDAIVGFSYEPEDFPRDEARAYLTGLVQDFLDRSSFDLLPFVLVAADKTLRPAYESGIEDPALRATFTAELQSAYEDDGTGGFRTYYAMKLLEVVETQVPHDAYDKVRRRFRPLDRGPARAREAKPASGGKRGKR